MEHGSVRARVDPSRCDGFGHCHRTLPDVFALDEWGYAYVAGNGDVAPDLREAAREAQAACPVDAIRLEDE